MGEGALGEKFFGGRLVRKLATGEVSSS